MKQMNVKKIKNLFKKSSVLIPCVFLTVAFQNCGELGSESAYYDNQEETELYTAFNGKTTCSAKQALSFPGAVGFGKATKGGRGGRVVHVTNTNNDGQGSLRWALEDVKEPRIVVFDVEGRIKLKKEIAVKSPYVTIAGQTAPGDGIVISGARIHIRTKEVIIRGLKSRPGDESGGDQGKNRDAVSIGGNGIKGVEKIVIDHNSFTWAVDETLTIWGTTKNITLSNNIIAEALYDSIHIDEGSAAGRAGRTAPHSTGLLIGHKVGEADSSQITITSNLLASNEWRNPYFKGVKNVEFVNNYINNAGSGHQFAQIGGDSGPVVAHFISNYFEDGRDSGNDSREAIDMRNPVEDKVHGKLQYVTKSKVFSSSTSIMKSSKVRAHVLNNVGARNPTGGLDDVDQRIVREVKAGTSRIIDSQNEVGGYSSYNFRNRKVKDSDGDGMPDSFEIANKSRGLNPNRNDANGDYDGDGYTNIEEYINGLIDGFDLNGCGGNGSGSNPIPVEPDKDIEGPQQPNPTHGKKVEAESMKLSGFSVKSNAVASGKKWVQSEGEASARLVFALESGIYDVTVAYFDENDGKSKMSLVVGNKTIKTFTWSKNLGSPLANSKTATTYRMKNVKINKGQTVSLSGVANGKEPLRTDYILFTKVVDEEQEDPKDTDTDSNTDNDGKPVTVEAENMDLNGFDVKSNASASGKKWVQSNGEASASLRFDLSDGTYDITIGYFDENDGRSKMSLRVDGKTIETFTWTKNLGSSLANDKTKTTHVIKGVKIKSRQNVELVGEANGKEPLRTDYIRFQKKKTSDESSFKGGRLEAEDMDFSSAMKVVRSNVASGSAWVQTNSSGSLSFEFDGPNGHYNLKLGYFDENDGVSKMSLKVSGKTISSWKWSKNLRSPSATTSTATTRAFNRVYLERGDVITFTGESNRSEPMRTDYLDISAD